jgi:GT2 family glycosyltransferase
MTSGVTLVSIVVPLQCGPEPALRCLEGIAAQGERPDFEVIVVDDDAPDLQPLLARLDGDVEVVCSPRRVGLAQALRLGAERARGDVIVALRDAAVPGAGWLAALAAPLGDPGIALTASVIDGDSDTPLLDARAVAVRATDVLATGWPAVADDHLVGTLAIALAQSGRRIVSVASSSVSPATPAAARHDPGTDPELTIVIPTLDAASARVRGCLAAIRRATPAAHEIVIVDNGSPPQGFAGPVNAGVRAARTPYVVIMNDDVEPEPGWWEPLRTTLDAGAPVAFPLTVDGAMRLDFAAWCFAISQDAIAEFGHAPGELFDPSLVIWFQDTDLLQTLRRAGRPPTLVRESTIRHGLSQTLGSPDPRLGAWVRRQVEVDKRRFEAKHPDLHLTAQVLAQ